MTGVWHPTGRARVSQRSPSAHAICQRCGFRYNRYDLVPQFQWAGVKLQNLELYVCKRTCLDVPQPALKTIVIPADPLPVYRPFPEDYAETVPNFVATESSTFAGSDITTEAGDNIIWEIEDTMLPDPNNPTIYPPAAANAAGFVDESRVVEADVGEPLLVDEGTPLLWDNQ